MAPRVVAVKIHEPDSVRAILDEAHAIALELEAKGAQYNQAFASAAELLGARATVVEQEAPMMLDRRLLEPRRPN